MCDTPAQENVAILAWVEKNKFYEVLCNKSLTTFWEYAWEIWPGVFSHKGPTWPGYKTIVQVANIN